jgi:hypothetical protein
MQDEEASIRKKLNVYILTQIATPLRLLPPPEPPLLGEAFAISSRKLYEAIAELRSEIVGHLSTIPFDQLTAGFADQGTPKTPEFKDWCLKQRSEFRSRFEGLSVWQLALLEPERTFPDYDYWSKAAFFSIDELLWLSVGLEPLPEFATALEERPGGSQKRHHVVVYLLAQLELFRRGLDPNHYERRHTPKSILEWANLVEHQLHPGFRRILEKMVKRAAASKLDASLASVSQDGTSGGEVQPEGATAFIASDPKRFDPRERRGMAKLLVALAIEQFGYDPTSKRGPIPKELEDIALRLGLEISQQTILKYLRLGAQSLPQDWKPHE